MHILHSRYACDYRSAGSEKLQKNIIELAKVYLASGINPEKSMILFSSQISEHAELAWILNTVAKVGDLTKMTQLKDKAGFDEAKLLEVITPREIKILIALEEANYNY